MRRLAPDDAAAAASLIRTAFAAQSIRTDPPSGALSETEASIAAQIAAGGGACIEQDSVMAAVVLWAEKAGGLYLGRLAVHPAFRRRGLARALVAAAEHEARARALPRLHLGARIGLAENRRLFAACGFVETGLATHPGYGAPTSVDMEKQLRETTTITALQDRIMQAHAAIRPDVPVTPLERSAGLSRLMGCDVLLKSEHLQPTGSFKVRGATNKLHVLGDAARAGVITASTGNHGQAVAWAGARRGVPVTVYVGAGTSPAKLAAIEASGAALVVVDGPPIAAELEARRRAEAAGLAYVSPYNDLDVVAGQGTLGVELHDQAPDLDAVFIAVGGGGLIGGAGTALKALGRTRVVGVWPENSPCMLRAMQAGAIIDVAEAPTLSDGTAGAIEAGSVTLPLCRQVIDETVTVTEAAIARAMRQVAETERWMIEGAAGTALAGLAACAERYQGGAVAVVLCGRNVALAAFLRALELC